MAGAKRALEYAGKLADLGYCPLVFPEGERTRDGEVQRFRPGIGMMAVRLRIPIIPVRITGLFEVYSIHDKWPKPGPVEITFGQPVRFPATASFESVARTLENAIRQMH